MAHFLFLSNKICCFLRAQCSALISSGIDYMITGLMLHYASLPYAYSTGTGCLTGGICNCVINYKWVFRIRHENKLKIGLRYLLVWIISLLLNTGGTILLGNSLLYAGTGIFLPDTPEQIFLISRITVSVVCAVFWNYPMQQYFVYQINQTKIIQDS